MTENNNNEQMGVGEAIAEAIGSMAIVLLPILIIGGVFLLQAERLKEVAQDFQEEVGKPVGNITGRVSKVETWTEEEGFKTKQGNIEITLDNKDRTRIIFEDGRSKEFIGIPNEPVPKDKDITIVWTKFNILLEIVDAEEYKSRNKEKEESDDKGGEDPER